MVSNGAALEILVHVQCGKRDPSSSFFFAHQCRSLTTTRVAILKERAVYKIVSEN